MHFAHFGRSQIVQIKIYIFCRLICFFKKIFFSEIKHKIGNILDLLMHTSEKVLKIIENICGLWMQVAEELLSTK